MTEDSSRGRLPPASPWLALGTAVAIAVLPFTACPAIDGWRHDRQLAELWPRLRQCLAGQGQLDDGMLRARAIEAETGSDENWPGRCMPLTAELEVTLSAAQGLAADCEDQCCVGDDHCATLEQRRHQLAILREQLDSGRFAGGVAAALLTSVPAASGGTPPPAPHPTANLDASLVMPAGYDASAMQPPTLLLHRQGYGARLCDISPKQATARCRPLPASVPTGGDVLLVDGAPEHPIHLLVRPDDDPAPLSWTVYDTAGVAQLELRHGPIGVAITEDGPRALVVDEGETFLVAPGDDPLRWQHETEHGPPLVWGDRVYAVAPDDGGPLALRRHRLDGTVEATVLLPLPDTAVALTACGDTVLLVATDDGVEEQAAVVFDRGELTAHRIALPARWAGLTCEGEEASLTWPEEGSLAWTSAGLRGEHLVHRIHCTPDGCAPPETTTFTVTRRDRASRYFAASLGGPIAFVWQSGLGDVRAHIAESGAPLVPHVVAMPDALSWRLRPIDLLAGDGWALLLAHGPRGAHAFILDTTGVRPVVQGQ